MVRIWNWIFKPATILAGAGVIFLALGASSGAGAWTLDWPLWLLGSAIAALGLLVALWVAWHRPHLGASD
jgi:hypothetical protein